MKSVSPLLILISFEWIGAINSGLEQEINNKLALNYAIHANLFLMEEVLGSQR